MLGSIWFDIRAGAVDRAWAVREAAKMLQETGSLREAGKTYRDAVSHRAGDRAFAEAHYAAEDRAQSEWEASRPKPSEVQWAEAERQAEPVREPAASVQAERTPPQYEAPVHTARPVRGRSMGMER